jgi:hypothetical protein
MKWPSIVAALALGALLGGAGVLAWTRAHPADGRDLSARKPAEVSQAELGRLLMTRVARGLVAVRSPNAPMRDGAVLFDAPKIYGDVLCSVRAYAFPAWIVRGRPDPADAAAPWKDDLRIEERYAVWREPGAPAPPGLTPETACARLHDVQHLILGEGPAVVRDVALVDAAIRQVRAGAPAFALTCIDRRRETPVACDGAAILRQASVRQIRQVGADWNGAAASGAGHLDMVFLEPPAGEALTLQLTIAPGAGGEDALRAIAIARDATG